MEKSKEPEKEKGSKDNIHGTSSQLASDRKTSRQPGGGASSASTHHCLQATLSKGVEGGRSRVERSVE